MPRKIFLTIFVLILITNLAIPVHADDDEIEEMNMSEQEIENIIETAVDITKMPNINSRYAVIYDRTSRKSFVWKAREYKV